MYYWPEIGSTVLQFDPVCKYSFDLQFLLEDTILAHMTRKYFGGILLNNNQIHSFSCNLFLYFVLIDLLIDHFMNKLCVCKHNQLFYVIEFAYVNTITYSIGQVVLMLT